jgi:hypothetical protein
MASTLNALTTGGGGIVATGDSSGVMQLQTNNGTTAVTIDTSQNVGIGTTSPTTTLALASSINFPFIHWNNSSNTNISFLGWHGGSGGGDDFRLGTAGTKALTFQTNATERMRIDSTGNVGIGTDSPISKLTVNGNTVSGAFGTGYEIASTIGTDANSNAVLDMRRWTGSGTNHGTGKVAVDGTGSMIFYTDAKSTDTPATTERLRITSTGTLTSQATYDNTAAGSTVIVTSAGLIRRTSSSLKYKKDVETLEQTIVDNAVNNLRPVWYRTKNADGDDKTTWSHIGLIAEEVDLVEPRLVKYKTVEVTQDENGANVTTELETPVPEDVDYAKLSVILLAKVKQLEARLAILEAK